MTSWPSDERSGGASSSRSWPSEGELPTPQDVIKVAMELAFHEAWQLITPENFAQAVGALASMLALVFSLTHMVRHWLFNRSILRGCILRLLFIVPMFAMDSWACLMLEGSTYQWAELLTCIRELYEAIALLAFLEMVLITLGGPKELAAVMKKHVDEPVQHVWPMRLVLRSKYQPGPEFILCMVRGIFQYAVVCVCFFMAAFLIWACVREGLLSEFEGKVLKGVANFFKAASCAWALNCLILFAHEVKIHVPKELRGMTMLLKFLAIKGIVFFTFWQGAVIWVCDRVGYLDTLEAWTKAKVKALDMSPQWWNDDQVKSGLNDLLLCVEVLVFSILHWFAYPSREVIEVPQSLEKLTDGCCEWWLLRKHMMDLGELERKGAVDPLLGKPARPSA